MRPLEFKEFIISVENIDGKEIGSLSLKGMGEDNGFVDIISYGYNNYIKYQYKRHDHQLPEEDFSVYVYRIEKNGMKKLIDEMDVCYEGDATFEEIIDLAYHGCCD